MKRLRTHIPKWARLTEEVGRTLLLTALVYGSLLGVVMLVVLVGSC